ncbi:hypothetical protein AWB79_04523 [Caballeronia hypogeia]|uniref:BioF2-like acetyltransferase domain-containing protein n=1 Tax=Caballeronia hypogeia TaxID=1777140 RepID=A0A158C2U5_9BURK|nr:GNAT family N-acetyltransferase [Caballeronia hypogeia]SAK75877.1 hypothetical protein AWB79_04523 [Caballeronia hypogeia]
MTSPTRFETISTIERFGSLREEWERLWVRVGGGFGQDFEFCLHALRDIAIPEGAQLHCIVAWKGNRLVLVWPLVRYRELFWRAIRPLAPDGSVCTNVLAEEGPEYRELVDSAWRMLSEQGGFDLLTLPRVRTGSLLFDHVSRCSTVERAEASEIAIVRSRLRGDWDSFRQSLPAKQRKELDTWKRRLDREGKVSMYVADLRDSASTSLIDDLFLWKQQWAEKTGKKGTFFSPNFHSFLVGLLKDTAASGRFPLFVLAMNGRPIAVNLVAVEARTVHGVQAAFDVEYGKFTPGAVLLEYVLKWAFESGRDFDFGAGGGKYKAVWAQDSSYSSTDFRISTSQWGRFAFLLSDLRRWYRSRSLNNPRTKPLAVHGDPLRSELEP